MGTCSACIALMAAMLEATTCPGRVDALKLHKMVQWTTHVYAGQIVNNANTRQLVMIGQHAARYACRKRLKLQ